MECCHVVQHVMFSAALELVESFGGGNEARVAPYGAETSSAHYIRWD